MSKPSSIEFVDGHSPASEEFAHVEPQDGYVFCRSDDGTVRYYPWRVIEVVKRISEDE